VNVPAVAAKHSANKALGFQRWAVADCRKCPLEHVYIIFRPRLDALIGVARVVASVALVPARLVRRPVGYAVQLAGFLSLELGCPFVPEGRGEPSYFFEREAPFLVVAFDFAMLTVMAEADETPERRVAPQGLHSFLHQILIARLL
jgi:hypothetical protein